MAEAKANFFEVWGKESPETMQAFFDFTGNASAVCSYIEVADR